jgi:acyl-coenzyme A thioesterase PaaI-like protein
VTDTTETEPASLEPRFIAALGIEVWIEGDRTRGRAELRPQLWAPGTRRPRLGLLATMVDMAGGILPSGALNPTVDLRIQLLAEPPSEGTVELYTNPVKLGRRLFVGEVFLHAGETPEPFGRATVTFLNQLVPDMQGFPKRPLPPMPQASFDELIGIRLSGTDTAEVDLHEGVKNGPAGTIQGGAQATIAEITAEHVLAPLGRFAAVDIDIRYVGAVRVGPAVARAEVWPGVGPGGERVVRVLIVDGGADGRVVSLVVVTCRPLPN